MELKIAKVTAGYLVFHHKLIVGCVPAEDDVAFLCRDLGKQGALVGNNVLCYSGIKGSTVHRKADVIHVGSKLSVECNVLGSTGSDCGYLGGACSVIVPTVEGVSSLCGGVEAVESFYLEEGIFNR